MEQDEVDKISTLIQNHLVSLGNYELISEQLKLKLYELGWCNRVSQMTDEKLNEDAKAVPPFDVLLNAIKPKAMAMVPENVREEILQSIREYLNEIIE